MKLAEIAASALRGLLALVLIAAVLAPDAAPAQVFDPTRLLGGGADEPQQSRPSTPLPLPSGDTAPRPEPSAADYGRIAASTPDPMLSATRQGIALFHKRLGALVRELPAAWKDIRTTLSASSPTGRPAYFIGVALFAGLLLVIGRAIAQTFYIYVARRLMLALQRDDRTGYLGKLPVLAYRFFLTAIGVAIAVTVASVVGLVFYQDHEATQITTIVVFVAFAAVALVDTIWRMALAPYLPEYRLPVIGDAEARGLYRWLSAGSTFGIICMAFAYWMQALGLRAEVHTALTILLTGITVLIFLGMIRVHRHTVAGIILAGRPRAEASWITLAAIALWAPVTALYLVITWGDLAFRLVMGIETSPLHLIAPYGIFMVGILVYVVASYLIERVFTRARAMRAINAELDAQRREEEAAETLRLRDRIAGSTDGADSDDDADEAAGGPPADEPPTMVHAPRGGMRTLEDLARRTASLIAIGAVLYGLARYWGGPGVLDETTMLGAAADVLDTLFIGYVVFHAVRIWVDQKIADEGGDEAPAGPGEGEGGGAGASRLATLLPLIRNFMLILIAVATALVLAVEFGINVAPLFAGAGIVGLAIGFGAQTLVRDILSGAFFLLDDAFRKGEYIDVGDVKGTVEKISIRSFQLRHHLGMLHTIPFGEIQFLTNFSRDWVMMKLPLRLTYDTDVEKVRKLVKKLGLRLLEDPEIGPKFIQPVKSQGVIQMDDSAMIVRVKFMTHPGEQWVLRKRVYAEIRELFEREGIKFAHREVTVRLPDMDPDRKLSEGEMQAIGAAARRVSDQVEEEQRVAGTVRE